ncbi:unnamed protein product [Rotaria sp. Silwood1]|nr:unnamed protein product [Rotaria sp. Silwood1]CAF3512152.1 unnamed protein product [Rotaria sp. Silwood1]CAF3594496.1 unnamed protein product [Rotaria sp. Silwood1]CAF3957237.1 unnamed protein product [Rotaria sp. Silwood1]CAF4596937.1 unnamed protein product [Rotaria sp. Silwood1]
MRIAANLLLAFLLTSSIFGIELTNDEENFNERQPSTRDLLDCIVWYSLQGDPNELLAKTVKPPCRVPTLFPRTLDGGWSADIACDAAKQPNTCSWHSGAYCCYRNALKPTGPGARACYDKLGS